MKRFHKSFGRARAAVLVGLLLVAAAALAAGGGSGESAGEGDGGGKEIVIGVDASMSGPLAGFGAFQKWASRLPSQTRTPRAA
jgi:hypothetical protein